MYNIEIYCRRLQFAQRGNDGNLRISKRKIMITSKKEKLMGMFRITQRIEYKFVTNVTYIERNCG